MPPECHRCVRLSPILEQIFRFLSPADIKAAALVCRSGKIYHLFNYICLKSRNWKLVLETPRFWSWTRVIELTSDNFEEIFSSQRFQKTINSVRLMEVTGLQLELFFCGLVGCKIRNLDLSYNDCSSVSPHTLSQSIVKLEKVNLNKTSLSSTQVNSIFKTLHTEKLTLDKVNLRWNNLYSVSAGLLSEALVNLEVVNLSLTDLTAQQVEAVFAAIVGGNVLRLKSLSVSYNNLGEVPMESLSQAAVELEEINLYRTELSSVQVREILLQIVKTRGGKLHSINLGGNNLSSVPPELLCQAVTLLETVKVSRSHLTPAQVSLLFSPLT